jgi:hypothetical protein
MKTPPPQTDWSRYHWDMAAYWRHQAVLAAVGGDSATTARDGMLMAAHEDLSRETWWDYEQARQK